MKIKKFKLIKLEDLMREGMYRDYLARLERDKKEDRLFIQKTEKQPVPKKLPY